MTLILIQLEPALSTQLLWITFLVLFIITITLLLGSIYLRGSHFRYEKKVEEYQNRYYPLVLDYLESESDIKAISEAFTGKNLEYSVFEKTVKELIDQVQGEDQEKLKYLMSMDSLFDFHFRQLNSRSDIEKIKACNYFSHTKLISKKVIKELRQLLKDRNRMVAYSAASALMASEEVSDRAVALKALSRRSRISEMAILELLYEFHHEDADKLEEESGHLHKIITDEEIPPTSRAVLIMGAAEINYPKLGKLFIDLLKSERTLWNYISVKEALIIAQGYYYNLESSGLLQTYLYDSRPAIARAAVSALSRMPEEENERQLLGRIKGKNAEMDMFIIRSLMEQGVDGKRIIEESDHPQKQEIEALVDLVIHEMGVKNDP